MHHIPLEMNSRSWRGPAEVVLSVKGVNFVQVESGGKYKPFPPKSLNKLRRPTCNKRQGMLGLEDLHSRNCRSLG